MTDEEKLSVWIMDADDIKIASTGREDAPLVLVIPKAGVGLGFSLENAAKLHDNLCMALSMMSPDEDELNAKGDKKPTLH